MGVFTVVKGLLCNEIDMLLGSDYQFEWSRKPNSVFQLSNLVTFPA
jgi:hypothetical protein